MQSFNRERFLYWLLGAVLGVNALFFGFGLFSCSRADNPKEQCPEIGKRFDNYSEKALAAVLGLIAGAGAVSLTQRRASSSDDRDVSASQPPLQLQQPFQEESVPEKGSARGRGKPSSPPEHQEPPRSSRKP